MPSVLRYLIVASPTSTARTLAASLEVLALHPENYFSQIIWPDMVEVGHLAPDLRPRMKELYIDTANEFFYRLRVAKFLLNDERLKEALRAEDLLERVAQFVLEDWHPEGVFRHFMRAKLEHRTVPQLLEVILDLGRVVDDGDLNFEDARYEAYFADEAARDQLNWGSLEEKSPPQKSFAPKSAELASLAKDFWTNVDVDNFLRLLEYAVSADEIDFKDVQICLSYMQQLLDRKNEGMTALVRARDRQRIFSALAVLLDQSSPQNLLWGVQTLEVFQANIRSDLLYWLSYRGSLEDESLAKLRIILNR